MPNQVVLVKLYDRRFTNESDQNLVTTDSPQRWRNTSPPDVSEQSMVTFFVVNSGPNPAKVFLQISPDGINWVNESSEQIVETGGIVVLVPMIFLRYTTVCYLSAQQNQPTALTIGYQAQI